MKKITLVVSLFLLLTGCTIERNSPQQVVETALNAIIDKDTWAFNAVSDSRLEDYILADENFYPDMSHMDEGQRSFYETIVPFIKDFGFTIDDVQEENGQAIVTVTITNYDIASCLASIQDQVIVDFEALGSSDINDYFDLTNQYFLNNIESYFNLNHQIQLFCIEEDQKWTLDIDDPSAFIYKLFAPQY